MIYLDNNATTQPDRNMLNAATEVVYQHFGNPSSPHFAGRIAKDIIEESRSNVAAALNCKPAEIVFTSGGTESNNIAISGMLERGYQHVCSAVEHSSAATRNSFEVLVNADGHIEIADLEDGFQNFFNGKTSIVSAMLVNNETGVILDPLNKLKALRDKYGFVLHVDAVQAFGKMDIDLSDGRIDLLSISAHKCHGFKGAGALYVNKSMSVLPKRLMFGGPHERGLRPGTECQLGIFSLGYMSNKISGDQHYRARNKAVAAKRDRLEAALSDISKVNGNKQHRVGNTTNLCFPLVKDVELLVDLLSEEGVCVSGKSACQSGLPTPSRVLRAMFGHDSLEAKSSIRLSLSVNTTDEEVDKAADIIRSCVHACHEMENENG